MIEGSFAAFVFSSVEFNDAIACVMMVLLDYFE